MEPKGNDMSDELVERLRKLAEKATPGERELNGAGQLVIEDGPALFELPRRTKHYTADHWFIAACSPDKILALLARLSRPSTAAVKPLVWNESSHGYPRIAVSAVGRYAIWAGKDLWLGDEQLIIDGTEHHASLEAAQAAAQSDYEKRIRAALNHPSPQGGAEPDEDGESRHD